MRRSTRRLLANSISLCQAGNAPAIWEDSRRGQQSTTTSDLPNNPQGNQITRDADFFQIALLTLRTRPWDDMSLTTFGRIEQWPNRFP
jgi:hypothetical protein